MLQNKFIWPIALIICTVIVTSGIYLGLKDNYQQDSMQTYSETSSTNRALTESTAGETMVLSLEQRMQKRISFDFRETPIQHILKIIATQADIDIIKSPKVTGNVTMKLTNVPVEEALNKILAVHGLTYYVSDKNTITITQTKQSDRILNIVELARKVRPAVVLIETFDKHGKTIAEGSGFFINEKGLLITNYHVIKGAYSTNIKTIDGKRYLMRAIQAKDENADVVSLLIDPINSKVPFLELANVLPSVGEDIAVVGNPFGLESTVSKGIVSAFREIQELPRFGPVLQITAPISPGSSGSPVLNMRGEVVGIVTFYRIRGQALNFAVPFTKILDLTSETSELKRMFGVITAILYVKDNPSTVIEGKILHEGDTIHDVKVIKIHRDKVEFEKNGETWMQKVQETPNPAWKK